MKALYLIALSLIVAVCLNPVLGGQTRSRRVGNSTTAPASSTPAQPTNSGSGGTSTTTQTAEEVGDNDVVRVNTTLITIPVSVSDRDGRYIYDLSKNDFQIFDNGVEQRVAYFATTEKPFTVVLLIDTSTSIWNKLEEIKEAANDFLDQLRPEDQVVVASFANKIQILCSPTSDRQTLRSAIRNIGRGSSTKLYDAMDRVMNRELTSIQGRKAIVLFTDGVDSTSSHASYDSNVQDAEELDGMIFPIRYDTFEDMNGGYGGGGNYPGNYPNDPNNPNNYPRSGGGGGGVLGGILRRLPGSVIVGSGGPTGGGGGGGGRHGGGWPRNGGGGGGAGSSRAEYDRGRNYLYDLAAKSGGQVYEAGDQRSSMDSAFRNIAEELRRQYSLGYYPSVAPTPGERRKIKVKTRRPDVAVKARDSYIYNPVGGPQPTQTTTADDQTTRTQSPPVLKHPLNVAQTQP